MNRLIPRRSARAGRCAIAVGAACLLVASVAVAQKRANMGAGLHNNMQQYTLRGDMGQKLDNNLRVGGTGYNTSGAAMAKGSYNARRASNYSPAVKDAARARHAENAPHYRHASNMSRSEYSPPMYSEAYRDALARTGRNPNVNPYSSP